MRTDQEDAGAEVRRLKTCIGDLLSLSATQALTRGREPEHIMGPLLEVLMGTLRLDLAYAEFKIQGSGTPVRLARFSQRPAPESLLPEIRRSIETWLADGFQTSPLIARTRGTDEELSLALVRLGSYGQMGWLLACSRREDFPTQTERLILGLAANQGAIGVQQAQLLSERTRIARELECKVRQRTKELRTANVELERALRQVDTLRDTLQRENVALREQAAPAQGGLAPWQLRRAEALMSEDLTARVPLGQLAQACSLSVRHFARAFRQSTGIPPHRWLLNRRIQRAKELLGDSRLSLFDVAVACGFGDQSHFTRMFSAAVGLSPGLWRRLQSAPPIPELRPAPSKPAPDRMQRQLVLDGRSENSEGERLAGRREPRRLG
jgi:AraC-like DNA-binding protein